MISSRPAFTAKRALRTRRMVWVGGLLIVLVAASAILDIRRGHRTALAAVDRELANLASAIAEQAARSLQTIDLILRDNVDYLKLTAAGGTDGREIHEHLKEQISDVPQVRALAVTDAKGVVQYWSRSYPVPELNVSDRPSFVAQRDRSDLGLFIGEPRPGTADGAMAISMSRRLEDAQGRFRGIVYASSDVDYFEQFYRAISLGEGTAIALFRGDGILLAHYPAVEGALGRASSAMQKLLRSDEVGHGVLRDQSPYDSGDRIISLRRVRGFPLVVGVSREERVALASWREEAFSTAIRTLALAALAALLLLGFTRQFKRLEQTEQSLRESDERYALAMTGSDEGHWVWDLDTDRVFSSARLRELHGLPHEPALAVHAEYLAQADMEPADRSRMERAIQEHLRGATPRLEIEYRVRLPDGRARWLQTRGQCFRDATGRPHRMAGSVTDITDRKHAEEAKQALEIQLRQSQKMEAMGTLAGGIAHDFNNILGAILGYGELALKSAATAATRRYLENVMHAGNRAKTLVERILAFSRSGMSERVPVHVESVVGETLELARASLPAAIELEIALAAGNASVIGDATQIHQVVMNLTTNAVQAMTDGGKLSVVLRPVRIAAARVVANGTLAPGDYLCLAVSDTGCGIAPDALERIFDPFFTTKGVGAGTGLGLSLIHGIVSDIGGGIEVTSALGRGSTFTVYLPVAGETAPSAAYDAKELARGCHETIMIVDDEQALVLLGEETLAELGYEPVGFTSSADALAALRSDPDRFDALLSDEAMPEMTGTDLAREARKLRPDMPIMLMSGHSSTTLAARASAAGVAVLLRKPLQAHDIAETLARVFNRTA